MYKKIVSKYCYYAIILTLAIGSLTTFSCATAGNKYKSIEREYYIVQYKEKDYSVAQKVMNLLEKNAKSIINDIDPKFNTKKVYIKIFPDLASLNSSRKNIGLSPSGVGGGNPVNLDGIWMVSPNNPGGTISYDNAIVVLHELTHLVLYSIDQGQSRKGNILVESICYYEAGQKGGISDAKDHVKWLGDEFLDENKYDQITYWNDHFYIGKFIKQHYGADAFKNLAMNKYSIESSFNISKEEFIEEYKEWLNGQRY